MKEDTITDEVTQELDKLLEDSEWLPNEKEYIIDYIQNPYGVQCTAKY